MTTLFTRFAAVAFALTALNLTSCKKDESQVVINPSAAPTLAANTTTPNLVLSATNGSDVSTTFTLTPANYGFQAVVNYELQVDKKGGNFSAPQIFSIGTSASTFSLTRSQLATTYFKLGYVSGTANSAVDVRVVATVGSGLSPQVSQVVTLTATPTVAPPACTPNTTGRTWSLIGPAGTDWNTDIPLTYDCNTQTFKAKLSLSAAEFKFRANNDWTVNFGTAGATSDITITALANGVPLVNGKNNLQITTAGTYNIELAPDATGTTGTVTVKP